ncbi:MULTISPECIES: RidA family protein [Acetoanaerobium]|jgi:2-iminobutanoate/2-iminopropanoate deaminase|uniref:Ketoacid-binding protein n=1 Tax=Acetoanaerobium sticklandii (strain ATCC 12662 / DSM 519 / JCM 1433 / CCUG 9281 / NCIMB 10654 / HF) TaxID=499177 RepID=E3PW47_ACESD|nr:MULTISPECIES: RidA family protein [Acetoanaerobium]MBP8763808.1 RidA family protein [Acetoanaerobium sp.]MBP9500394.1 RidA family protein [Acetoanaerobium sp.]MBP9563062.1 RidA family protein [Acetoanaerobium sp.]CBH20662.1 ketoacid-binding protein [Acetoanaerobium sticklandii]
MSKKVIATEKAPGAIGPYSQAMRIGNMIFTSGQIPLNPATGEMVTEIAAATKQSLENVKAILEVEGATMDNVIKTTVFLSDMNNFVAMNEVYATYFPQNPPARSAVEVARLPKDAVVEIEVIAAL